MRALVLILDSAGVALLVAAAWSTWGLGAGMAALGASALVLAVYVDFMAYVRVRYRARREAGR